MSDLKPDQLQFRQAMAHLAAAVNIVTTEGPHGRLGITVSAVCSVTDSPPTVLVCVNQRSAAHDVFTSNGVVAINVLASEQSELARHFAGATSVPMQERFAWDIWDDDAAAPTLRHARVAMVGRIRDTLSRGTHSVMFVEIDSIHIRDDAEGLVYYDRGFHRVSELTAI
ncbi:4-hydroxyphenylacetate 3-monooxygenase reductase subunit [Arthrobacter sp. 24S4-2]|uniref:flavin reductase n=1 Tax=Arthrobacter sp. 24S4-2 TaxID=2575374 RepID=UPI0010C7AF98|nr:flavin reductase [Arthrobacter sp. 24S4-2]QCP00078.1 4-hydroxyphenylacetate 3-monooxygenase reductase subunit [Arthrobacter sp. 24S4-2]